MFLQFANILLNELKIRGSDDSVVFVHIHSCNFHFTLPVSSNLHGIYKYEYTYNFCGKKREDSVVKLQ